MRICLIGVTHPCHNPRLVREADSLTAGGHRVRVVYPCATIELEKKDARLRARRHWYADPVDFRPIGWKETARAIRIRSRCRLAKEIYKRVGTEHWMEIAYTTALPELIEMACQEPADWFIAHAQGALPVAARAAEHWRARLGFDCEDLLAESGSDPAGIVLRIEKKYLSRCEYVSAPSRSVASRLAEQYRIPAPVVLYNVFPLYLAASMLRPTERPAHAALRLHWFSQRIGPGRGIEDAVEALELMREGVELHLRGHLADDYAPILGRVIRRRGVADRVFFHPQIDHDDLIRSMVDYDVGLALERPENTNAAKTISNKLFSYALAGLAIAATDTSGQREALDLMPRAGFLFPAGDAAALAAGLKRWLGNANSLRAAKQAAWNVARDRLCWDREKEQFLQALSASEGKPARKPTPLSTA